MPNEGAIQEIQTEIQEAPQVSNEPKADTPYSAYFSNPEVAQKLQNQINTYKAKYPKIEETFTNYLKNNPNILHIKNMLLEKSLNDPERFEKQINSMIDSCSQEINVFPKQEIKMTENIQVKNNEQLIIKEQVMAQKEQNTDSYKEQINKHIQEVEASQKALIAQNPKLDIKPNSPQYVEASKKLEASGALKTLTEKGLSAENINKFISFKATQEAIKADPSIQNTESFLLSFKKLENELDLPDSTREDFSSKNIEHTSQEIFNPEIGNQNLIDTVSEQKKTHAEDFEKLFDEPKDIGTLNDMYGKFLPESQKTYKTIQDKQEKKTKLSQDDQEFLSTFKAELDAKKTEFESKTTESMEQSTILGPIMGLANYMDMGIGNTFEFNKSNDIKIDNNTLSITGNIDNKPFTLETNLDRPNKLKTSDYLNKADDINMGIGEQNRQETAYIMPAKTQIRENIKENFQKSHQDILKNCKSLEEYQEILKKSLCENVQKLYGFKDLVQIRIEKQMTKNVAAQETLDMLNTTVADGKFNYGDNISKDINPQLHHFLWDLDYSLENLSSEEIADRRKNIKELTSILTNNKEGNKKNNCKILQDLSPALLSKTEDIMNRKTDVNGKKTTSLFTFFESLKDHQSKTYRIEEFKNLLEENKKTEPNEKSYKNILENRNRKTADDNLDLSLLWV